MLGGRRLATVPGCHVGWSLHLDTLSLDHGEPGAAQAQSLATLRIKYYWELHYCSYNQATPEAGSFLTGVEWCPPYKELSATRYQFLYLSRGVALRHAEEREAVESSLLPPLAAACGGDMS